MSRAGGHEEGQGSTLTGLTHAHRSVCDVFRERCPLQAQWISVLGSVVHELCNTGTILYIGSRGDGGGRRGVEHDMEASSTDAHEQAVAWRRVTVPSQPTRIMEIYGKFWGCEFRMYAAKCARTCTS